MDTERLDSAGSAKPPAARFRWGRLLLWVPACLVHGGLVAWAAVLLEKSLAPVLLFSILVGVVLGVTLVGMMRLCQVGNRPTILLGTVLAASVAVLGQHYVSYRVARREALDHARAYQLAKLAFQDEVLGERPVPPAGFIEFLRWRAARGFKLLRYHAQGGVVWTIWAVDGLLVLAAALSLVVPAVRRPYCDRCRSWFSATRRGPLDLATARQLAALVQTGLPDKLASARYRLVTCNGGCGPAGFELRWEEAGGKSCSGKVWLDRQRRNQVVQTLDEGLGFPSSTG